MTKKRSCKVILHDEVNCYVDGLHADHAVYFFEKYGLFAKGYFFNPKFQLGSWDGKIRFFHKTGKTFVNLLDEIIPSLINLDYDVAIDDRRKATNVVPELITKDFFSYVDNPDTGKPWEIRDYQIECANSLMTNAGGIIIAGTGGGKTSICAALALSYERAAGFRSIIIVPDTTLTEQTKEEYEFFGLDVGDYCGTSKDLDHQHIVATWQTLKNNPMIISDFDMVICDEVQGARGPVLNELLVNYGKDIAFRFGCTGTLPEEESDAMSVRIAIGAVQYEVPAHYLIEQGHLSNLDIDIVQMTVNMREQYDRFVEDTKNDPDVPDLTYQKFKESYFPDFTSEKKFLHSEESRIAWIANYIENFRLLDKGNTLVLVNGIAFGKKLAKIVPDSVFLHGSDHVKVRKEIYESFKEKNDLIVFATVNIAGTGLNIKRIFNLVLIDIGKSFIRVIQAIGRGLRKAHDKDYVYVGDICGDLKYSKRHLSKRMKYYKEAKYPHKKRKVDY